MQDWIVGLLKEARTSRHYGQTTKETARWAKEVRGSLLEHSI